MMMLIQGEREMPLKKRCCKQMSHNGGTTVRLTVEVAQMAVSMRDIATQNMAMRELLKQTQGQ